MLKKVLVVDDERGVRESMRMLLKDYYQVAVAASGSEAIAVLKDVQPDVVLLDLRMPDMSGIDVLQSIKAIDPNIEVILVTAYATVDTARKALRLGAFDYLTKPFDPQELESIVRRGLERRIDTLRRSATLEAIQQDYRTLRQEVELAKHQMHTHVRDTIYALLMSLELRDAYSGKHSMAVLWLVDQFALQLGITPEERNRTRRAALVHDLGKIGIPEDILNKPEPLSPADQQVMHTHPRLSEEIITNVEALADLGPIVRAHHERWDGNGYPDGLSDEAIPWQSQVLAICDTVHAMSSERCYRSRLPEHIIRRELAAQRGRQFNPAYVDAMLAGTLISDIHSAENAGKMVLTSQQIRQVLGEPTPPEPGISTLLATLL
jgi:putative two-component system response regulator